MLLLRSLIFCCVLSAATAAANAQGGLPPVPTPAGNPTTPDKVLLGKTLFFEEQMSSTSAVACATCHELEDGSSDPRAAMHAHPGPDGVLGTADDVHGSPGVVLQAAGGGYVPQGDFRFARQVTPRRAMSVINAAFMEQQFWDGRAGPTFEDPITGQTLLQSAAGLEAQIAETGLSDVEMAHIGETWPNVVARLQSVRPLALASNLPPDLQTFVGDGSQGYGPLFLAAFGTSQITPARIAMAIAAYERTLISDQAPIDAFLAGNQNALTAAEQRGFQLFTTSAGCMTCHIPPTFTFEDVFLRTGVRPPQEDPGRGAISGLPQEQGAFKIPSLRNVELRPPFFHNGGKATLADVVDFYDQAGDFGSPFLFPLFLTPQDKADLVAFLGRPLTDPRVANGLPPFDRPTLWSETASRRATVVAPGSPAPGSSAPRFVLEEPAYGESANFTIAIAEAPAGVPGVLLIGGVLSGPVTFGNATLHVVPGMAAFALPLPATVAGGSGVQGNVGGVLSVSLPLPDLMGLEFPIVMQAVFPDPIDQVFVASPAVEIPLFPQRGT